MGQIPGSPPHLKRGEMTLVNGDGLLPIVCAEIEKNAPFVFAQCAERLESADETDVASPEKSSLILIIDQRADIIGAKCELPRGAV